jgi:diadenosine tetraphosphatase ApaH/serine/threonine PP2A family protein phosphatase
MLVAVVSDVHANLHALEAVLADIDRERVDALWSLGDVVGYGPQPNRCCELVAAHADISLCGNHDLGALRLLDLDDFSPEAAAAARWTTATLSEDAREYLRSLEPKAETPQAALVHGSPRDPIWEYVLTPDAALAALEEADRSLLLVGHSHVPLALELAEGLQGGLAPDGAQIGLDEATRRLLNPGSVGQPRDGDPRAAWLLLDFGRLVAAFRRVPYAIGRTQAEIRDAGLPEVLATRLESGT